MKIIAINGSPRKTKNTATLLKQVLDGANSLGAEIQLIHLYDLNYKGCTSCFACKLKNSKSYGKCAYRDELTPVLQTIETADALILGSPIYFGAITGAMHSFLERLMFQYLAYVKEKRSLFGRTMYTAFIYTMNVTAEQMRKSNYTTGLRITEQTLKEIFGQLETLTVNDTYQFNDYSKYAATAFDPVKKEQTREKQFPHDCAKAYALGRKCVESNSIRQS